MVYLPSFFAEARPEILIGHIERHEFGLLVSHGSAGLVASHIPFLIERDGAQLHLHCHLARPNPQVGDLAQAGEVLAIFHGPHAYISPSWYVTGPSVPTWNYVDVHAYGTVRLVEDADWLRRFLGRLSERHEPPPIPSPASGGGLGWGPWRMQDLPKAYFEGMLKGIIGVDVTVTRLEGKYKLSQNRPAADRPAVIAALEATGDADANALARLMREREPG